MWLFIALVFSFGCVQAAPPGSRAEGKVNNEEIVLRLVLHVQKTEKGAQLVVNLEETPPADPLLRPPPKPLLSVRTDFPAPPPKTEPKVAKNATNIIQIKTVAEISKKPPPKFDFKISVNGRTTTTTTSEKPTDTTTTEPPAEDILSEYPKKTVADQGFGILASRCATYAPGLVSDNAGGCTKPAGRLKKKNFPGTFTFRSAQGNELHADVKASPEPTVA